jgi:hypothetical protein
VNIQNQKRVLALAFAALVSGLPLAHSGDNREERREGAETKARAKVKNA